MRDRGGLTRCLKNAMNMASVVAATGHVPCKRYRAASTALVVCLPALIYCAG